LFFFVFQFLLFYFFFYFFTHSFSPFYLFTFSPFYLFTFLPFYLFTFLPFHLSTIPSFHLFTFSPFLSPLLFFIVSIIIIYYYLKLFATSYLRLACPNCANCRFLCLSTLSCFFSSCGVGPASDSDSDSALVPAKSRFLMTGQNFQMT
jgi:hypothetical protein